MSPSLREGGAERNCSAAVAVIKDKCSAVVYVLATVRLCSGNECAASVLLDARLKGMDGAEAKALAGAGWWKSRDDSLRQADPAL